MPSVWFVVPVHGRAQLAQICLRQLRRTCDALTEVGTYATAVVVGDDDTVSYARDELGFAWAIRDNLYTSLKFNDGILLACQEGGADYVVPCGSDDWVDWRLFRDLPDDNTLVGFQHMSFVREDGRVLSARWINSEGGCGIRILPRALLSATGFWPADPDRKRGCDTSMLINTKQACPSMRVEHRDLDPLQIVDWKSPGENLNPYESVAARHRAVLERDPFDVLAGRYPAEALDEMAAHYSLVPA